MVSIGRMTNEKSTPARTETKAVAENVEKDVCADCGSTKVVVTTDGKSAEARSFCAEHRPYNVPLPE